MFCGTTVPVKRDEQRLSFPPCCLCFLYICVSSTVCLVEPALPAFLEGDLPKGDRRHARTTFTDAPKAALCERHSASALHRREVRVTASSSAAIAQISSTAGVVSYLAPKRERHCLLDAMTV